MRARVIANREIRPWPDGTDVINDPPLTHRLGGACHTSPRRATISTESADHRRSADHRVRDASGPPDHDAPGGLRGRLLAHVALAARGGERRPDHRRLGALDAPVRLGSPGCRGIDGHRFHRGPLGARGGGPGAVLRRLRGRHRVRRRTSSRGDGGGGTGGGPGGGSEHRSDERPDRRFLAGLGRDLPT